MDSEFGECRELQKNILQFYFRGLLKHRRATAHCKLKKLVCCQSSLVKNSPETAAMAKTISCFSPGGFLVLPPGAEESYAAADESDQTRPRAVKWLIDGDGYVGARWVRELAVTLIKRGCAQRKVSDDEAERLFWILLRSLGLIAAYPRMRMPAYLEELWGRIAGRTREYPLFCKLATMTLPTSILRGGLHPLNFDPLAEPATPEQLQEFRDLMWKTYNEILPNRVFSPNRGPECVVYAKTISKTYRVVLNEPADSDQLYEHLALLGEAYVRLRAESGSLIYGSPIALKPEQSLQIVRNMRGC